MSDATEPRRRDIVADCDISSASIHALVTMGGGGIQTGVARRQGDDTDVGAVIAMVDSDGKVGHLAGRVEYAGEVRYRLWRVGRLGSTGLRYVGARVPVNLVREWKGGRKKRKGTGVIKLLAHAACSK